MCGILGIINNDGVAYEIYKGLIALQHRGQDGAGIATFNGSQIHLKKGIGLVGNVFGEKHFQRLKGNIGIGHVRYPTWGIAAEEDVQPFYISYPYGIAMAHNGQVTNYSNLEKMLLEENKRRLSSTCDAEAILHVFAEELNNQDGSSPGDIFNAVEGVFEKIKGSYSVIALIAGKGLLAFRDPYGIRPLVLGKGKSKYAIASESVALKILECELIKDIQPGSAVFIDNKHKVYEKTIRKESHNICIFEYVYFARPDSVIDDISVYEARLALGKELARLYKKRKKHIEIDVVIPVPDTARPVAIAIAEELRKPYREGFIKNRYIGRTFIMPKQGIRKKSVELKLSTVDSEFKSKKILLIDDSIVRGTTSRELIEMAKSAGASAVYFGVTCPPLKYPCVYGIDMSTRGEFIARDKTIAEIKEEIKADEIIYQNLEGMVNATKGLNQHINFCTACFTGQYPTEINQEVLHEFERNRLK